MSIAPKISVILQDGSGAEFEAGSTGTGIAAKLGLEESVVAVESDGLRLDLGMPIPAISPVSLVFTASAQGREIIRHSASHIMAEAVVAMFPGTRVAIGPSIEDGFYYDFDLPRPLTEEDLPVIEARMAEIAASRSTFVRREVSLAEAREQMKGQDFKQELLDELEGKEQAISLYTQGGFTDLCRGPHVPHTGFLKPGTWKLLSVAGAYWRGDERRPMLQRIYGTAFDSPEGLDAFLKRREEIARRDHRKLGRELDIYSINPVFGPGLVLWHPAGAKIRHVVERFWVDEHVKRGYDLVYTPHIASEEIFQKSGHLEAYSEMMYAPMQIEGKPYRAKPMNCPGHLTIFQSRQRSYRDLPVRYAELGTVYRYERSGTLHGMLRVRGFTQDDAHIFCRPDQLKNEVNGVLDLTTYMMKTFGYEFKTYLATKPEKSIGSDEEWAFATDALRRALEERGMPYEVDEGGGVFYAPKIDLKILDALGREWQGPTCQVDLNLPVRFGVEFVDVDGSKKKAVMIHRTVLGSMERFIGGLIEHYAGAFPLWLAPVQVRVIPVSDAFREYAAKAVADMRAAGLRAESDDRNEKVGFKIREGEVAKIPYLLVVGKREAAAGSVSVRKRGAGDEGAAPLQEFVSRAVAENRDRSLN